MDQLNHIIAHLFLPKRTPDAGSPNLEEMEGSILHSVNLSVSQVLRDSKCSQLDGTKNMLRTWEQLQPISTYNTPTEEARFVEKFVYLTSIQQTSTIPVYIRRQNCTLLIEQKDDDLCQIRTFRAALPSELVTGSVGPLSMSFPETCDIIQNKELFTSRVFASSLFQLAVTDIEATIPSIRASGKSQENWRGVAEPFLISEWLVSLLSPTASATNTGSRQENNNNCQKKVRDQVTLPPAQGVSKPNPFRRSGMWMSIKVALQLQLLRDFNNDELTSKLVYKLLILRILADVCKTYYGRRDMCKIDLDLAAQLLAKIGRRVHKLQKLPILDGVDADLASAMDLMKTQILAHVQEVVQNLHQFMKQAYGMLEEDDNNDDADDFLQLRSTTTGSYLNDLDHTIPFLSSYREPGSPGMKTTIPELNITEEIRASLNIKRYHTLEAILAGATTLGDKYQLNERTWLHDTETFIKEQLTENQDSEEINELLQTYVSHSLTLYQGNPSGISQMILVILKTVEILDRIGTKGHPLLLEYQSGINCSSFDCLILPHKDDMQMLDASLNYFHERNKNAAMTKGIVADRIDERSFAVRFAAQDKDMLQLRDSVLRKTDKKIGKLAAELQKIRDLEKEIGKTNSRDCLETSGCPCRRCMLKTWQTLTKARVNLFERPLPTGEVFQNAVIFEELIPQSISDLRNSLAIFKFGLLDEPLFDLESSQITMKWLEYENLKHYLPWKTRFVKKSGSVINLGSRCLNSLTANPSTPNKLKSHPESFILENGMQCIYGYSGSSYSFAKIQPMTQLKLHCSFKISETSNPARYLSLQPYLETYEHFQNEVIANQHHCHGELFLEEFIAFGSLRGGHRIQLRNLYRAISSRLLSFEEEPVLALILQTIWQVGPSRPADGVEGVEKIGNREAHLDFEDDEFSSAFLELLEELVKENESKYNQPLTLLTAIVITVRIMELNEKMDEPCYSLLKGWRQLIKKWTRKLEAEMMNDQDSPTLLELQRTLLLARICSALSYNFSTSAGFRKGMREPEDIVEWFHTIFILHQNQSLGLFQQLLLNVAKNVALRLNLEAHVLKDPLVNGSIFKFVSEKWRKSSDFPQPTLQPAFKTNGNLILLKYTEKGASAPSFWITFDLILGTFLINGLQGDRLDPSITGTEMFQRYFRNHSQLRVQKESATVFRTAAKFHGRHYEFHKTQEEGRGRTGTGDIGVSDGLCIKEIGDDGSVLTLLEQEHFRPHFTPTLVDNFTHWFDPNNGILYFRRVPTEDEDYGQPHEYKLVTADQDQVWHLFDEKHRACWLNIASMGYGNVAAPFFQRLELKDNVNVLLDREGDGDEVVTVHLPRYGLRFTVREKKMECMEYPGFYLSAADKKRGGTLLGLEQGIQLENGHKRLLIIPNGDIHYDMESGADRQVVKINLEELWQPPYFVYEFDQVLRRLVANKSKPAWLYLAALYAVTSSSLPDPFTGVTGTEMAVRILQSSFLWSSSPYDEDSLWILKFIGGLSPKRSYHGEGHRVGSIEVIEWPTGLPSMAVYDGFQIIVDKMIEDSHRLEKLYYVDIDKSENKVPEDSSSSAKLRLRSYFRHLRSYNQGVAVETSYFSQDLRKLSGRKSSKTTITNTKSGSFRLSSAVSLAYHRLPEFSRSKPLEWLWEGQPTDLASFLSTLSPALDQTIGSPFLKLDFSNWFKLYKIAIQKQKSEEGRQHFTMILCGVAYSAKAPAHQLLNLHYIAEFADEVEFPSAPSGLTLERFQGSTYPSKIAATSELAAILMKYVDAEKCRNQDGFGLEAATSLTEKFWLCKRIPYTSDVKSTLAGFNWTIEALNEINDKMAEWHCQAEPKLFADEVQKKLDGIFESLDFAPNHQLRVTDAGSSSLVNVGRAEWSCDIRLDDFLGSTAKGEALLWELPTHYLHTIDGELKERGSDRKAFLWEKDYLSDMVKGLLRDLLLRLNGTPEGSIVSVAGLCQRTDPTTLLSFLIQDKEDNSGVVKAAAGSLAMLWSHIKRSNRCLLYIDHNQTVELERELENRGHENWSPREDPEWLLLELELDIMIRPVQVEVAMRMMSMPGGGGNGITQLNMGEGKTSVIVPMICSTLSKRREQLCRVTVLGSIFNMNYATLAFAIGGLLNRRIYTVPCKRDMDVDGQLVEKIQSVFEECLEMKGTVLALPEHRLSFRLLAYDKILKEEVQLGIKLHQTENWLRDNVRDVMDEADELLNVKYQLIYTIGGQAPLDGGDLRWVTCQRLLKIVQKVAQEFSKKFDGGGGDNLMEFDLEELEDKPHQFAPIRLLDAKIYQEFAAAVADHFLEEIILTQEEKAKLKRFLTQKEIEERELKEVLAICEDSDVLTQVLVTSGYLRRGVLTLALSKRWRVEYGVDTAKSHRLMAVPFRAKDVAAERTEFGHPDLAILLTHLSYYYSGLSCWEMDDVFQLMRSSKEAEGLYRSWIHQIPDELVPGSLTTLRGINFKDAGQKGSLYELLSKHKSVIDFWLSIKVFPKEAKEFPAKLVMTAWDLCYERQKHPITGFSGTNDSSLLLPLPVTQQDLPSLLETNKKVEAILLQPENNQGHRKLEMGVSCREILEMMKDDNLSVLIDAGALMLECSNEQLASMWLEVNPGLEATLYFNESNNLMVKWRSGRGQSETSDVDVPFELSSYKGRLEKCGVFLDDQHTRGTDIKFPVGARACVTVGGRMKRDKLIQACMRMRKLGFGQSVTFYMSHEASGRIMTMTAAEQTDSEIETNDILEWVSSNTKTFNEDGLLYWATSGKHYAQRLVAEDYFRIIGNGNLLGEQCKDLELLKLMELYGTHVEVDLLVNIIPQWFAHTKQILTGKGADCTLPFWGWLAFDAIADKIVKRCREHIPTKVHYSSSNMEEEQERELEPEKEKEVEEEAQIEKVEAHPAKHALHPNVVKVVYNGKPVEVMPGIQRLCDIFRETSFWEEVMPEGWGNEVFATADFISVISDKDFRTDSYLRPIEYVVSGKEKSGSAPKLLLLSPFEVNELMPWFRTGDIATQLHMFSPRKSERQDLLLNDGRLVLPKGVPATIPEDSRSVAALLLASGNLYFQTMDEQRAFALFISLAPQPWTEEEKEAFDNGLITKSVFMMPQYKLGDGIGERPFAFSRDPSSLIRMILMGRHAIVSDMAHVIRLLNEKVYVELDRQIKN